MLTHRITLPDGTAIEFFASDEETFSDKFGDIPYLLTPPPKKKANKAVKQARKRQKQARRKQR